LVDTHRVIRWSGIVAALAAMSQVGAQASFTLGPYVYLGCETVRPGMWLAHDAHEAKWARAWEAAKTFRPALAMQQATGGTVTCWASPVDDYAGWERLNAAYNDDAAYAKAVPGLATADAQYISALIGYFAKFRPDLSSSDRLPNLLAQHSTIVEIWRVRIGQEPLFEAAAKAYFAAARRAGVEVTVQVYQSLQGEAASSFWVFSGAASFSAYDASTAAESRIFGAMTAEESKAWADLLARGVNTTPSNIWTFNAIQSQPTPAQRAFDKFWALPLAPKKP
jgi:hypothetical protein